MFSTDVVRPPIELPGRAADARRALLLRALPQSYPRMWSPRMTDRWRELSRTHVGCCELLAAGVRALKASHSREMQVDQQEFRALYSGFASVPDYLLRSEEFWVAALLSECSTSFCCLSRCLNESASKLRFAAVQAAARSVVGEDDGAGLVVACLGPGFFFQEALLLSALVSRGARTIRLVTIDDTVRDFADWLGGDGSGSDGRTHVAARGDRLSFMRSYLRRHVCVMDLVRQLGGTVTEWFVYRDCASYFEDRERRLVPAPRLRWSMDFLDDEGCAWLDDPATGKWLLQGDGGDDDDVVDRATIMQMHTTHSGSADGGIRLVWRPRGGDEPTELTGTVSSVMDAVGAAAGGWWTVPHTAWYDRLRWIRNLPGDRALLRACCAFLAVASLVERGAWGSWLPVRTSLVGLPLVGLCCLLVLLWAWGLIVPASRPRPDPAALWRCQ